MKITVETEIARPVDAVWTCWTTPADILQWNAANEDWHTTAAHVDLTKGGRFSYRMEAKDGSMGFDYAGTYLKIVPHARIEADLGGRSLVVEFIENGERTVVCETFDADDAAPVEMQRAGWQAILDNFRNHTENQAH